MLAGVLFVLLAGVPVCRGAKGAAYSTYYDADGDQNADFYDSYNDEMTFPQDMVTVMEPITRLKRRDLDDIRTLTPEEIIDVKGVLNNILQGKQPESVRGRRTAGDYTDSYNYLESSVNIGVQVNTEMGLVPQKTQPTGGIQKSSTDDDPEYLEDRSNYATEQHWSFVYQPDTSTTDNNDIVAEDKQMISTGDAVVPTRSSIDDWRPTQKVKTWSSTETEDTEDTLMYPLESTTYSNSDMQDEVRKLVQHWSSGSTVNMQEPTTTYSNSDMQAEVRKLVQHWSSSSSVNQVSTSYNSAAMRGRVKQLIQHWRPGANDQHQSPSSNVQLESHTSSGQHRGPSMAKEEMNQQQSGMQTELMKLPWNPILQYKHWSAHDNVQHQTPSDNVQHQTPSDNVQHQTPSDNVQHQTPSDNVQHWSAPANVQHQNPSINVQQQDPSMNVQYQDLSMNVHRWRPSDNVQHWSATDNVQHQTSSDSVQHWSAHDNVQHQNPSKNVQQQDPSMNVQYQDLSMNVHRWRPSDNVQHWSATDNVQHQTPSDNVQHQTPSDNVQHQTPSENVQHWSAHDNVQHQTPSDNVQHQTPSDNVQHWSAHDNVQHQTPSDNVQHQTPSDNVQHWSAHDNVQHQTPSDNVQHQTPSDNVQHQTPSDNVQHWSAHDNVQHQTPSDNVQHQTPSDNVQHQTPSDNVQHWSAHDNVQHQTHSDNVQHQTSSDNVQHWSAPDNVQHWSTYSNVHHSIPSDNVQHQNPSMNVQQQEPSMYVQQQDPSMNVQYHMNVHRWRPSDNVQHQKASVIVQHLNPIAANSQENLLFTASKTDPPSRADDAGMDAVGATPKMLRDPASTTLEPENIINVTTTVQTTTTTTTTPRMDIDAIMAIISNLTYDYEWNLTEQFNKTIIEHGVPTCPWEKWGPGGAWTATTVATTLMPWDFENTSVVSKCFVCGLHTPEIPRNAFCADAFAGDFLPLMPIDAQSRGKIAGFRKYCRYIDTQNYIENPDEPRAIYGRFTGGCAVRWTDITGVYTQRTCRSKYRPLLGKHFASKRMAKLELALVNVENGCIISPMATLLPVSRGISLYARFHACVCSSNWCNRATILQASFNILVTTLLAYWLVHYP